MNIDAEITMVLGILVPRALLTRGATIGYNEGYCSNTGYIQRDISFTMFLWYPVLARAPRRTARKKGSGYENGF
jgi:hypothetical protein